MLFGGQFEMFTKWGMEDLAIYQFYSEPPVYGHAIHIWHPITPGNGTASPEARESMAVFDSQIWRRPRSALTPIRDRKPVIITDPDGSAPPVDNHPPIGDL
jgi:hypothetical protein